MTIHLSVNNYYGINNCNTIYMSLWKNEDTVFFLNYLYYLFFLFFIFQHVISMRARTITKLEKLKSRELKPHMIIQNHKTRNIHFNFIV